MDSPQTHYSQNTTLEGAQHSSPLNVKFQGIRGGTASPVGAVNTTRQSTLLASPTAAATAAVHNNNNNRSTLLTTSILQTPSGPILTPKDRASMILLSPSRTISESLTTLASSTVEQLEQVWDEVGYSPEERAQELSGLLVAFRNLANEKITEERGVAETYHEEIEAMKQELVQTSAALKRFYDPSLTASNSNNITNKGTLVDQLATLEAALEGLRQDAASAKEELEQASMSLKDMHDMMGMEMDEQFFNVTSDLTHERRQEFATALADMKVVVSNRTNEVMQVLQDLQTLLFELKISDAEDFDRRILSSLVRSKDGSYMMVSKHSTPDTVGLVELPKLQHRLQELSAVRKSRKERLQDMGTEIASLWEKLHVSAEDQELFTQGVTVTGLGMDTLQKGEEELKRLHSLKTKMLGSLLVEARERISALWNETNTPEAERKGFAPFHVHDVLDDTLLDQHDEYVHILEARLEQMKPILRLVEKREEIVAERTEYEELQHNSERLQQRGAALTKQLMREEKMAKRIKRELPKLTSLLDRKLQDWKAEHGEDFLFGGTSYLKTMCQQDEEWKEYKETQMQAKLKKKQKERAAAENRYGGRQQKNSKRAAGAARAPLAAVNH